jgi:hypothetical protein
MWIVTTRNCILHLFSCVLIIRLSRMKSLIDAPCVNHCDALWPWSNVNRNLIPKCWTRELDAMSRRDCDWIETLRAVGNWSRLMSGVSQWCHWWNGTYCKLRNALENKWSDLPFPNYVEHSRQSHARSSKLRMIKMIPFRCRNQIKIGLEIFVREATVTYSSDIPHLDVLFLILCVYRFSELQFALKAFLNISNSQDLDPLLSMNLSARDANNTDSRSHYLDFAVQYWSLFISTRDQKLFRSFKHENEGK